MISVNAGPVKDQAGEVVARLVALSGWGQEKDRERSRAAGFDHHLVKPVDLELLRELLSRPSGHRPREADFLAVTGRQRVP
jgi:CheY-like chemotaxis protein